MFGQRNLLDSFLLSKVVTGSIFSGGRPIERQMPKGLDVMAALGSDTALRLLEPELVRYRYAANLRAARAYTAAFPRAFWSADLYRIWLDTLSQLDDQPKGALPEAMRTQAWQLKQLQSQLASWSQLRHDTVLYTAQSYGSMSTCKYPDAYVEPYPEVYARIRSFAQRAATLLSAAGEQELPQGPRWRLQRPVKFFRRMEAVLETLESLARKELASEPFSESERKFLRRTVDAEEMSGGPTYDGWYIDLFYQRGESAIPWDPTITDVHTSGEGRVLQVGVGNPSFLMIAIDNQDYRATYVGPMFSYYEFERDATDRLVDPTWKTVLSNQSRPEWTRAFQPPPLKRDLSVSRP